MPCFLSGCRTGVPDEQLVLLPAHIHLLDLVVNTDRRDEGRVERLLGEAEDEACFPDGAVADRKQLNRRRLARLRGKFRGAVGRAGMVRDGDKGRLDGVEQNKGYEGIARDVRGERRAQNPTIWSSLVCKWRRMRCSGIFRNWLIL